MLTLRRLAILASALVVAALSGCAGAPEGQQRTLSGTYSVVYDNVGLIAGVHSGHGKLVLNDGSEYAFTADGYSLASLGYSTGTASGNVYNLRIPADFAGEYRVLGASAVFGGGSSEAQLVNPQTGVVIDLNSKESGLRLGLGGGFVTFAVGEKLRGPRASSAAPSPARKKAEAPTVSKPMRYDIEFGFDKSRVNLATGRLLDIVAAAWRDSDATFEIVGHADRRGQAAYNIRLSKARAQNIARALVERGIAAGRITTRWVGEGDLAVATADGKRLRANRRVVIKIHDGN